MPKVVYTLEGIEVLIECSKDEKIKDICQNYANTIEKDINTLIFIYSGMLLNSDLTFEEQANMFDKERNQMNVLVFKYDNYEYVCYKCNQKFKINKEKKNDIILSVNNLKDIINGIKLNIDNIIKTSNNNSIKLQLKNVNLILNTLDEDIKKINDKIIVLFNNYNNTINENKFNNEIKCENKENYISAEVIIKNSYINKNIRIINSYEEYLRTNPGEIKKNVKYNNEDEIKKCQIKINDDLIPFNYYHKFKSKGKYQIKYLFKNNIINSSYMFGNCNILHNIDLSNLNTYNITNLTGMFYGCSSLDKVNLSDFNTNNVTNMSYLFFGCSSLTNINLSSFNTDKVTNMSYMFYNCNSLTNINLSNFKTSNVNYMSFMFHECSSLTNINLSNFNTDNVIDMSCMFYGCSSLITIDLSNFNINNDDGMISIFCGCKALNKKNIIIKKKKLLNNPRLFNDL